MRAFAVCQVALAVGVSTCALALGADAGNAEVRNAVLMLRRLERTCSEYDGPNADKLVNALALEAVRLYEGSNYDPALDSVLLAWGMSPAGKPRTYYGLQPGMIEVAVRWPSKKEAALMPLDARKYAWVMVAVTNVSAKSLRLSGLRAVVEYDGQPLKNVDGKLVESIPPDDRALRAALGRMATTLRPPRVKKGETATFPMVFDRFRRWTEIRFVHEPRRIYAPVRNYAKIKRNFGRRMRAQRVAATYRARIEAKRAKNLQAGAGGDGPKAGVEEKERYVLIGYIRNEVAPGKFGIKLVDAKLAKDHETYFVRQNGVEVARLTRLGSGSIAERRPGGRKPGKGSGVYVLVKPKKKADKKK